VDYQDTGISLTLDSTNDIITATAEIFSPNDVGTIWKFGGPSIDDFPAGAFFYVKEYRSPTQIKFEDGWLWPIEEDDWGTDANDWCGPFEKTSVLSLAVGVHGLGMPGYIRWMASPLAMVAQ
jgi:hypothetical protein